MLLRFNIRIWTSPTRQLPVMRTEAPDENWMNLRPETGATVKAYPELTLNKIGPSRKAARLRCGEGSAPVRPLVAALQGRGAVLRWLVSASRIFA